MLPTTLKWFFKVANVVKPDEEVEMEAEEEEDDDDSQNSANKKKPLSTVSFKETCISPHDS